MADVYDFKGRRYKTLSEDGLFTHLECLMTGAYVRVATCWFDQCGFRRA